MNYLSRRPKRRIALKRTLVECNIHSISNNNDNDCDSNNDSDNDDDNKNNEGIDKNNDSNKKDKEYHNNQTMTPKRAKRAFT